MRYEVPNLNACSDINSWRVIVRSFITPNPAVFEFSDRKSAVRFFEAFVNWSIKHSAKHDLSLIQGFKTLLEEKI